MSTSDRVIDVYDDVMEPHVAELIDNEMKKMQWEYGHWKSDKKKEGYHWTRWAGKTEEEIIGNGFEWLLPIWETAKEKYNFVEKYRMEEYVRVYMNAHTFGIEPNIHYDDGDFTLIYYPRLDWKPEWGGGTFIYDADDQLAKVHNYTLDKLVDCRPNRLLVFDAYLPHQGQPIIRDCHELRYVIVFKSNVRGFNRDGLDFYKED